MALVTKTYTFSAGSVIVAAEHNTNFDTLYDLVNGSLDNANIKASAAIVDTKLAQITTAGKVDIGALSITSQTQGDVAYYNGTVWTRLAAGTSGKFLQTKGNAANPEWATTLTEMPAGSIVQVVNTQTGAVATGTVTIPDDDTIPQNTEGTEFMTLAITPTSATNKLLIEVTFVGSHTSAGVITMALYQDSTANALASWQYSTGANELFTLVGNYYMTSGTTSATTFKIRVGHALTGAGLTFNGLNGARKMGGVMASNITISEVKV